MDIIAKTGDTNALLWHSYLFKMSTMTHGGQYVVSINNLCVDVGETKKEVPEDVILRLENSGYIQKEKTPGLYNVQKIPEKYVAIGDGQIKIKEHEYKTLTEQFNQKEIDAAVKTFLDNEELPFTKDPFKRLFYLITKGAS